MGLMNRFENAHNRWQGKYKRVLCVCSAGLLISPTTAFVLSNIPYNYNTRSAGIDSSFALIPVDEVLIEWADEIVCMSEEQKVRLTAITKKPVINLDIEDSFAYRDPILIARIREQYDKVQ